jgi:hypothetical protein
MTDNGTNIVNFDAQTGALEAPSWLIPHRTLANRGLGRQRGELGSLHLEEVRDHLKVLADKQQAHDYDRSFSQLHVDFQSGRVIAQFLGPNGLEGEPMLVHKNAYSQMCDKLLPRSGGNFLLELASTGEQGRKAATGNWFLFRKGSEVPVMFRTVYTRDPLSGKVMPMIRAQQSQGYGVYDNLTLVEDMLSNAPELRDMPVIHWKLTDTAMRLRFAMQPTDQIELHKPIPILEGWNSEAGQRNVILQAGAWKLICWNGISHWDTTAQFKWRHYGNSTRIEQGVESALNEIRTAANGVVEAYDAAGDIFVEDVFGFIERELKREKVTGAQISAAQSALDDETTTQGNRLTSVVDAITLAAQDLDLFLQSDLERAAARTMQRGRSIARDNGGRIPAAA